MKIVIPTAILLALSVSGCALAQVQRGTRLQQQLEQRFAAADADHDGRLTREEARQGMPSVETHFDAIDTARSGSVTLAQVKAHARALMAQRRGAGEAARAAP